MTQTPANIRLLVLANGILNPVTRKLIPHTPRYFNTFPPFWFGYDPGAKAPGFFKFLNEIHKDQENRLMIQRIFSLCLYKVNPWQVGFLFFGSGANGKGVLTKILETLLGGKANVTSIGITSMDEKFDIAPLKNAWLNISQDMAEISQSKALSNMLEGNLKHLIANEDFGFQEKYKNTEHVRPTVKFIFCTNKLPYFADRSDGIYRRFRYIEFKESFVGREDTTLETRLLAELPGILNWVLDGLQMLMNLEGETFPDTAEGRKIKKIQRSENDATGTWLREHCEDADPGEFLELNPLYEDFKAWHEDFFGNGRYPVKATFKKDIKRVFPRADERRIKKRVSQYERLNNSSLAGKSWIDAYCFYGIRLKPMELE